MRRSLLVPSSLRNSSLRNLVPILVFALFLGLGLAACGGGEDEASIEERLEEKGTMEVMEEAGKAEYDPPADGRLTEAQVEQYIAIQQRAAKIRQVAQKKMEEKTAAEEESGEADSVWSQVRNMGEAMQGFGDVMTAEIRAAQEMGHNPAEYQWVKAQVVEALAADAMKRMSEGMGEAQAKLLAGLEEQRDQVDDPERKAAMERQIEAMRESMQQAEEDELDAAMEHNIELVKRYEEEISAAHSAPEEEA